MSGENLFYENLKKLIQETDPQEFRLFLHKSMFESMLEEYGEQFIEEKDIFFTNYIQADQLLIVPKYSYIPMQINLNKDTEH